MEEGSWGSGVNGTGSAAYARYEYFSWLTNGALTCPLVLAGCALNFYTIALLRRNKKLRDTISLHLCSLAAWDAALLLATFGYYGLASLFVQASTYPPVPERRSEGERDILRFCEVYS